MLRVSVTQAPEKGKANKAVARILAKALGVGVKDVELVAGPTSPRKEFRITGLSLADFREALGRL